MTRGGRCLSLRGVYQEGRVLRTSAVVLVEVE